MVQTSEFKQWYEDNQSWVQPYAAFCFLRDLFGSAEHWKWGSLSHPTQQACLLMFWLLTYSGQVGCVNLLQGAAYHDLPHAWCRTLIE